jgi:hypothetical protein
LSTESRNEYSVSNCTLDKPSIAERLPVKTANRKTKNVTELPNLFIIVSCIETSSSRFDTE